MHYLALLNSFAVADLLVSQGRSSLESNSQILAVRTVYTFSQIIRFMTRIFGIYSQ